MKLSDEVLSDMKLTTGSLLMVRAVWRRWSGSDSDSEDCELGYFWG